MERNHVRRMMGRFVLAVVCWCLSGSTASAQETIAGVWWSPKRDAKIEISEREGIYTGRIIAEVDRADSKNPNPKLRGRRLVGVTLMTGMKADGGGKWSGGTFYDPDGGTTYKCRIRMEEPDRLMMRGYVGITVIGRTVECERVSGLDPRHQQAGEPVLSYLDEGK